MIQRRRHRKPSHLAALARPVAAVLERLEPRQLLSAAVNRISVASNGDEATAQSGYAVLSGDGRYVAFESTADNLLGPGADTNGFTDIYLRDTTNNTTRRVSLAYDGSEPNANCVAPSISSDGRYIAFTSTATNLVPGDTNAQADVFLVDTTDSNPATAIRRISLTSTGSQGDSGSDSPSISADGRYVAFLSNASNLVPNDTNNASDVFVVDTQAADPASAIRRVSTASGGQQANGASYNPVISGNGNFVAFLSDATNFVANAGDTNSAADVFLKDLTTGSTRLISATSGSATSPGAQANGASGRIAINNDATAIAYESLASNLVSGDANNKQDIFLFKVTNAATAAYTTTRVSVAPNNASPNDKSEFPTISADGRFVAYMSPATNLVPNNGDTNAAQDVFLYDASANSTTRFSVGALVSTAGGPAPTQANDESRNPSISANGRYVAFFSNATNLIGANADNNGVGDIFVRDRLAAPQATITGTPDGSSPQIIPAGDTSPTLVDGTDFGLPDLAGAPVSRTFTITNNGSDRLIFSGGANVVTISGANAADFTVTTQPAVSFLDPGDSTTFTVSFHPSAPGPRAATLSVASNDPTHAAYTFAVSGVALDSTNDSRVYITQNGTAVPTNTATPFSFGNLPLSSSPNVRTFTITNVSTQTLTLANLALDTTGTTFEIVQDFGSLTLASGASTTFTLRLNAATAGPAAGTVHFTNTGADTKNLSFEIAGTVTVPHLTATLDGNAVTSGQTTAVDLGAVIAGTTATHHTLKLTNTGQAPLVLSLLNVPAGFAFLSNPTPTSNIPTSANNGTPVTLAPGVSLEIVIFLNSSATPAGDQSGTLTITTNDPAAATFSVPLKGKVTVPAASVSLDGTPLSTGATITVGTGVLGQTGPTRTITITNSGPAPLNIGSVKIVGPNGSTTNVGYTVVTNPASSVQPGQSTTLVVRLNTATFGTVANNTLSFTTNDPSHTTYSFPLTGNNLSQALTVFVDGAQTGGQSVPFGTLPQSPTPVTRVITLRNDGTKTINLTGPVSVPAGFSLASAPSTNTLAPGASTTFAVSFTPIVASAQSGVLSIPTDDSAHPTFTLGLTASVTPADKTSLAVASVSLGKLPTTGGVVLGGPKANGTATVSLINYSSTTVTGSYKVTVYAAAGLSPVPGADKVLGTATVKVNLKRNAKVSTTVKLSFPAPPSDGPYNIVAVVSGAKVDPVYSINRAPVTVRIEKPAASLGATPGAGAAPVTGSLGKKVTQSITVTNTGNLAAKGTLAGTLYLSKDGSFANATSIASLSGIKFTVKAHGSAKATISFALPKTLPAGFSATSAYPLIFKLTKVNAPGTPTTIPNDGLIPAGKLSFK